MRLLTHIELLPGKYYDSACGYVRTAVTDEVQCLRLTFSVNTSYRESIDTLDGIKWVTKSGVKDEIQYINQPSKEIIQMYIDELRGNNQ